MPGPRVSTLLARARLARAGLRGRVRRPAPCEEPMLEPLLVRGSWGRVGSTLLMQLLATSPDIAFDRVYPFEHRHLADLLRYLRPLAGPLPQPQGHWMDDPHVLWWVDPAAHGFTVQGDPLGYPDSPLDRAALHRHAVRQLWHAYSDVLSVAAGRRQRFYAEKYGGDSEALVAAGIPHRFLELVRDPRDVWLSVRAFDAQRGFYGFGRTGAQGEAEYFESFLAALQRRMAAMGAAGGEPARADRLVVKYEDLVEGIDAQARRIGEWLGVPLDPDRVRSQEDRFRHHMTSASAAQSVGRWRTELPATQAARVEQVLGDQLGRFGYR